MLSLRERQARFADALAARGDGADERIGIYRNTVRANYRSALGASYRVVAQLVGTPFFHAVADAYVLAHPSTGGDLNVYGERFAEFLATYPHAQNLPYLPDVARLEWAVDEAGRAADNDADPEAIQSGLAAVPVSEITAQRFALDPSCRFVASAFPVLRIWQVHAAAFTGDRSVAFDAAPDRLLVRREAGSVAVERLADGDFAWLYALARGGDLAAALAAAMHADAKFDLSVALRRHVSERTIARLVTGTAAGRD